MNLLKRAYYDEGMEQVVSYYKCSDINELFDFIQENRNDIVKIVIDSDEAMNDMTFLIRIIECTTIRIVEITTIK